MQTCNICNSTYKSIKILENHLKSQKHLKNVSKANNQNVSYDCEYCTKKYKTQNGINKHILTHARVNEKTIECHCEFLIEPEITSFETYEFTTDYLITPERRLIKLTDKKPTEMMQFKVNYNGLRVPFNVIGDNVYFQQIPVIVNSLVETMVVQFPLKATINLTNGMKKFMTFISQQKLNEIFKTYTANSSDSLADEISQLSLTHKVEDSLKIAENMRQQLAFGAGSNTHSIPQFENEHIFIPVNPSPNPCLLNCVLKQIDLDNVYSEEYRDEIIEMFRLFIGEQKITKGRVPQSKLVIWNESYGHKLSKPIKFITV